MASHVDKPIQPKPDKVEKLDTHYYDGKLLTNSLVQIVQEQQENAHPDLSAQKNVLFTRLIEDLKRNPSVPSRYRPTAIIAVNRIMTSIRQAANYDPSNGMYADDVLYLACKKIAETKNVDALVYLSEQLSDVITSGQCAQGRSTRIFQVLFAIESCVQKENNENVETNEKLNDEKQEQQ